MKKSLIAFSLLCSSTAFAQGEGAYLGVLGGVESLSSEVSADAASFGSDGGVAGLYAGYQFPLSHRLLMGLEVDYQDHGSELVQTTESDTSRVELEKGYGINATFSYQYVPNVHLIGRLGLNQMDVATTSQEEDSLKGAMLGVGVAFYNRSNMVFRMEYRYTTYDEAVLFERDDSAADELSSHGFYLGAHYQF